jgi:hypothetical protein
LLTLRLQLLLKLELLIARGSRSGSLLRLRAQLKSEKKGGSNVAPFVRPRTSAIKNPPNADFHIMLASSTRQSSAIKGQVLF